ncbi:nitroreductase family protein [Campylobacter sp. JMF_01 NE2]|uniref:nitroreductase family protein n=1 Tax=unclassified Campylobacter TaxID=2593542 RepID=UPI0022E9C758|nr:MULTISPECIES: nitroreductase family protein [unclassified Campylobacter]MDA3052398.1 nitroreductase family protein [Campylobacter sp. JMF_03 NE3]MDA3066732.1 nitroreductase family protein [Campylobacter sp. JMF_01 NE2]
MEILEILKARRSVRKYAPSEISDEILDTILKAGLLSPSGHARKSWEFIVVKDKANLAKLSLARTGAADMLKGANAAVVVIADESAQDVWIEDASIAMAYMHLCASALGVGSCWIQCRLREAQNGASSEEYLREILGFEGNYRALAILSLGDLISTPAPHKLEKLEFSKIHKEKF